MSRAHQARRKERERALKLTGATPEQTARTSRRRSVLRKGSIAAAAAVIAGALLAIAHAHNASSSDKHAPTQVETEVSALLNGIPQRGDVLGQTTAPITLQIFGDLECEDVRTFFVWLLPDIIRDWVRTNTVRIEYHSFMTDSKRHPNVFMNQQVAALSAGEQDKMWNFIEVFYHEQGQEYTPYITEEYLEGIADQSPGLSIRRWRKDRENSLFAEQVVNEDHTARTTWGFHDTPSFLIGRTGGKATKLLGDQLIEEPGSISGMVRLRYPVSYITTGIVKAAIERLP